jgi:thiol-disulfide isomerase/thioredoxin
MAALALAACGERGTDPEQGSLVKTGDAVPSFTIGDFRSPDDFEGKRSLLVFFNTWCPDCRRELPFIEYAWEHDIPVVAIGRGESMTDIDKYWNEHGFTMPRYSDPSTAVYGLFAEHTVPRVYLVDETATVVWMAVEDLGYGEFTTQKGEQFIKNITQ